MTTIEIVLEGPDDLERHLTAVAETLPQVAGEAAWMEFSRIMNATLPKVPVSPHGGLLRASNHVDQPVISSGEVSVTMGFSQGYAGYVEAGQPHRKTGEEAHHGVGQSHFMEETFKEFEPEMLENIAKRIDSIIEGAE